MQVSDNSFIDFEFINNSNNLVVFIHGLGADIHVFDDILKKILKFDETPSTLRIFVRGHSKSKDAKNYNNLNQLLDRCSLDIWEIIDFITKQFNKQLTLMISHSLGTLLSFNCFLHRPDEDLKYILISPLFDMSNDIKKYLNKMLFAIRNEKLLKMCGAKSNELLELFEILIDGNKEILTNLAKICLNINIKNLSSFSNLNSIDSKFFIFQSIDDEYLFPCYAIQLSLLANSPIFWLDGPHADLYGENADKIVTLVKQINK